MGSPTKTLSAATNNAGKSASASTARLTVDALPNGKLSFGDAGLIDVFVKITSHVLPGEQPSFGLELLPVTAKSIASAGTRSNEEFMPSQISLDFCGHETGVYRILNFGLTRIFKLFN